MRQLPAYSSNRAQCVRKSVQLPDFDSQPTQRFDRNAAPNHRHKALFCQRRIKGSHPRRNQTRQFSTRELLSNAASWAVEKGHEREVAAAAPRLLGIEPPLRDELARVGAPQLGRGVDGPGRERDGCAFGKGLAGNDGVADGDSDGECDGRKEAEGFVADCLQVAEAVDGGRCDGWCPIGLAGNGGEDLFAQRGLDFGVLG